MFKQGWEDEVICFGTSTKGRNQVEKNPVRVVYLIGTPSRGYTLSVVVSQLGIIED